jgi:outer membrane protein assembly factor BamB
MRYVILAVVAILLCGQPAYCADAPTFRGDLAHSGVYTSGAVPAFHGVKWRFHTGGPVVSSPAVADGLVYIGSADGKMYAIDRDTGLVRWKFATKGRVVSSPAVVGGAVYFTSYDSDLYALDAATGKLKWKYQTVGEHRFEAQHLHGSQPAAEVMPDPFDVYLSSPVVWHGSVYFGSGDNNVYALDAATGALRWKFNTGDIVHASPAITDGTLFIGSWDGYFYALDAANGTEKWRFKTGDDPDIHNQVGIQSSAAIAGGIVYFGCRDSHLYALDAGSGRQLWSFPTHGSWVVGSPAVNEGKVYFATSDSGLLYALNAKSGAVVFSLGFKGWPFFSSPSIAASMLYIGSWNGALSAVDLEKQRIAWTFRTDLAKKNGPLYTKADGSPDYAPAYASDFYDDMVVGYTKMMSVGSILSSPVIVDRVIYVGSMDGDLYALM